MHEACSLWNTMSDDDIVERRSENVHIHFSEPTVRQGQQQQKMPCHQIVDAQTQSVILEIHDN